MGPAWRAWHAYRWGRAGDRWDGADQARSTSAVDGNPATGGKANYEVGPEFVARFLAADADNARFFAPSELAGHAMFDLAGYIADRVQRAGVATFEDLALCTFAEPGRFFSYRRTTKQGEPEWPLVDNNSGQDIVMWYTQGAVANRSEEHLGLSDRGIILYRKLLQENLERVQRGEDPMNVFRDPAHNVCLELPVERAKFGPGIFKAGEHRSGGASKYSPIIREAEAAAAQRALT